MSFTAGTACYLEIVTKLPDRRQWSHWVDRQRLEEVLARQLIFCRVECQAEKELYRNLQRGTLKYWAEC